LQNDKYKCNKHIIIFIINKLTLTYPTNRNKLIINIRIYCLVNNKINKNNF